MKRGTTTNAVANAKSVAENDAFAGSLPHDGASAGRGTLDAPSPLALRADDAARVLGIGTRQLWSLTKAGSIPHVRIGRSVVYHIASLEEWLRMRTKGGQ